MSVLVQAVLIDSLIECTSIAQGEPLDAGLGAWALGRLNQIIDNWNGQREAVYSEVLLTYTFIANQQTYSIGPGVGANFATPVRPVSIENANVILNTTPAVYNKINVRDYQWWVNNSVRAVSTTFPTDLWYQPLWQPGSANGQLNFYPVPTVNYGLELTVRSLVTAFTLTGVTATLDMPPGYQNALMLTLAEDMAPGLQKTLAPSTVQKAREARSRIFMNNDFVPQIATQDYGMPSNNRNRTTYNFLTGQDVNVSR